MVLFAMAVEFEVLSWSTEMWDLQIKCQAPQLRRVVFQKPNFAQHCMRYAISESRGFSEARGNFILTYEVLVQVQNKDQLEFLIKDSPILQPSASFLLR